MIHSHFTSLFYVQILTHNEKTHDRMKIASTAPLVNRLLFADDWLFFTLANWKAEKKLKENFKTYMKTSHDKL